MNKPWFGSHLGSSAAIAIGGHLGFVTINFIPSFLLRFWWSFFFKWLFFNHLSHKLIFVNVGHLWLRLPIWIRVAILDFKVIFPIITLMHNMFHLRFCQQNFTVEIQMLKRDLTSISSDLQPLSTAAILNLFKLTLFTNICLDLDDLFFLNDCFSIIFHISCFSLMSAIFD